MIVLVIICILAAVYFVGTGPNTSPRADGMGKTVIGGTILYAKDATCRTNLNQLRTSLQAAWTTDEAYPATLEGTKLGPDFYRCPVGGEAYEYDPSTGKVTCPHVGHRKY